MGLLSEKRQGGGIVNLMYVIQSQKRKRRFVMMVMIVSTVYTQSHTPK